MVWTYFASEVGEFSEVSKFFCITLVCDQDKPVFIHDSFAVVHLCGHRKKDGWIGGDWFGVCEFNDGRKSQL